MAGRTTEGRHDLRLGAHGARHSLDNPSPTVAATGMGSFDYDVSTGTARRKFTIAEVKRLCSFPDDYVLSGTYAQQWARLGNSVPPLMARAIGDALRDVLLSTETRG